MSEPKYTPLNTIDAPPARERSNCEMQDFSLLEDNEAFKRIRNLTQKLNPFHIGNLQHYLSLLEIAFENSLAGISADEQGKTLKILRDYDPIVFDILCDLSEVDSNENYQVFLKRMILILEGRKEEVNYRYIMVMGLFPLTGKVPPESAQYSDFIKANYFKVQRNFIIFFLIIAIPMCYLIYLAITSD